MNKRLLLTVFLLVLAVSLSACGDDNADSYDNYSTTNDQPSAAEWERRQTEQREAEKPKLNDKDDYWEWTRNRAEVKTPTPTPTPLKSDEMKELMTNAIKQERNFDKSVKECAGKKPEDYCSTETNDLDDSFSAFVTLAHYNPAIIVDVERTFQKVMKEDRNVQSTLESVMTLKTVYANDPLFQGMVNKAATVLEKAVKADLIKGNYRLANRYTASWYENIEKKKVIDEKLFPNDCLVSAQEFRKMILVSEATNNQTQVKFWTIRLGDYFATSHGCESGSRDIWTAYALYESADEKIESKAMAKKIGLQIFGIYLHGDISEWYPDRLIRHNGLEFDLNFAKEWLGKTGMNEAQIDQTLKQEALRNAKIYEKYCTEGWKNSLINNCELASKQYSFAGDKLNADRMALLIPQKSN